MRQTLPFTVALTGGIASGKSAVSDALGKLGAAIVDTDVLAREVVLPGSDGLAAVVAAFGPGVLDDAGALDRRALRQRVFDAPAERERLNAILHPRIRGLAVARLAKAAGPYAVLVVPLLVESGQFDWVERVLVVDVDVDVDRQMQRLTARDGIDATLARAMIAAQVTRAQRLTAADDVIVNRAGLDALQTAVALAHRRYLVLAGMRDDRHES